MKPVMRGISSLILALGAAGLASAGPANTVAVSARGETTPVGTANDDAADDPAIWRNPKRPGDSLIVATDKKAGLYVYDMAGKVRSFEPDGRLNNVDLIDLGQGGVIVVASDRNDPAQASLRIYRLNTTNARLKPLGIAPGGAGEGYGLCLLQSGRGLYAFSVLKHGVVEQVRLDLSGRTATGRIVRSLKVETQAEGCVADPRTQTLYVGEEARGIWAFDARFSGKVEGRLVAQVDSKQLFADVEGLAILPQRRKGGWLIASSQGDNAYALYRLPDMTPAGRFRIAAGQYGATDETDGIALAGGKFGPIYPDGLLVVQDGDNAPHAQNFKLVSWQDVLRALASADVRVSSSVSTVSSLRPEMRTDEVLTDNLNGL